MDDQVTATKKRKFTLIELLMILMLVGIIFTLVIPMVEDRRNNERVIEAIRDVTIIREANQRFREGPGEGFYAFDISQLNVDELLDMNYFTYTLTDTAIIATSTENYSVEGAQLYYDLVYRQWRVKDNELSRDAIDPNWLP